MRESIDWKRWGIFLAFSLTLSLCFFRFGWYEDVATFVADVTYPIVDRKVDEKIDPTVFAEPEAEIAVEASDSADSIFDRARQSFDRRIDSVKNKAKEIEFGAKIAVVNSANIAAKATIYCIVWIVVLLGSCCLMVWVPVKILIAPFKDLFSFKKMK